MNRSVLNGLVAAFVLLALSGCVQENAEGVTRTFTNELWVPLSVLFGGVLAAPAGWFLRNASERIGWALLILGPAAALFLAPSLFLDKAVVDDKHFTVRTGIWGMTAVHEVFYDTLQQVRLIAEESRGRRGRKRTSYYLLCEKSDGTQSKIPLGNSVVEAAAPYFLQQAESRSIPVVDET